MFVKRNNTKKKYQNQIRAKTLRRINPSRVNENARVTRDNIIAIPRHGSIAHIIIIQYDGYNNNGHGMEIVPPTCDKRRWQTGWQWQPQSVIYEITRCGNNTPVVRFESCTLIESKRKSWFGCVWGFVVVVFVRWWDMRDVFGCIFWNDVLFFMFCFIKVETFSEFKSILLMMKLYCLFYVCTIILLKICFFTNNFESNFYEI